MCSSWEMKCNRNVDYNSWIFLTYSAPPWPTGVASKCSMVMSYLSYMSNSPAVLINTLVLSSKHRLLPQPGVVSRKVAPTLAQSEDMLNSSYATSQSEESVAASTYPLIFLCDTDSDVPRRHLDECEASRRHLDECEASRRHLEECSVCSRQTSSLTSENSQVPSSQNEATLTKLHPHTQVLHPLIFTEAGTQTDINISNGVSCMTTAKLLLGVFLSAVGFVGVIFVMKCKFRIGFQMNMCYYMW